MRTSRLALIPLLCAAVSGLSAGSGFAASPPSFETSAFLTDPNLVPTGVLYDRVVPLSGIELFDGTPASPPASPRRWRQMYHEIHRASLLEPGWPDVRALKQREIAGGVIPVAIMNFEFDRVRASALEDGSLRIEENNLVPGERNPFVGARVFAVSAMEDYTYRGANVRFQLDESWYLTNDDIAPTRIHVDFGDGSGPRQVGFGSP
jgi:hypothetical protein